MILIIGGFAQGKLHYVEQYYVQREDRQEVPVLDGTLRLASDSKITWAVSYTHLDVYKRQMQNSWGSR